MDRSKTVHLTVKNNVTERACVAWRKRFWKLAFASLFLCGIISYIHWGDVQVFGRPNVCSLTDPEVSDSALLNGTARRIHVKGTSRHLPSIIIIGAKKCGTRALLEMMNLHPRIRRTTREVHFFDRDVNYLNGLPWYRKRMPFSFPDQLTVEKTPGYFVSPEAPVRIRAMNKDVKLLLIVRDPVIRTISDYTQVVMTRNQDENDQAEDSFPQFEDMVFDVNGEVDTSYKAVRTSIYARFFPTWLEYFKREQIHVVDGENLVTNPFEEMRRVEIFLGVERILKPSNFWFSEEKGFYCLRNENGDKCLGPSKGRKHPNVSKEVVSKLRVFYSPFNVNFSKLADINFTWLVSGFYCDDEHLKETAVVPNTISDVVLLVVSICSSSLLWYTVEKIMMRYAAVADEESSERFSCLWRAIWPRLVCFLSIVWAVVCGGSRIKDRRHHWWDVLTGAVLGFVVAFFTIYVDPHRSWSHEYEYPQKSEEVYKELSRKKTDDKRRNEKELKLIASSSSNLVCS
ncbi:unnamed protein product [Notodromas monacha]|uniref:Sulfotransferase n=1 Tax=Notodromas monacha TaxID=399045 RepID=A0A7R9BQS5_9CRUS|nr:unnamed protein product [Notodromas monacha]CAG0919081.1 unnamed protein product [Notodromas monacha]